MPNTLNVKARICIKPQTRLTPCADQRVGVTYVEILGSTTAYRVRRRGYCCFVPFDVNVRYALVVDVDDGSLQIRRHHFYRATRMHSADDAVARCPSVCLSVCHTPVFRLNDYTYPQFISLSRSPTILVFPYQTGWQYSDGDPLTGASNAKGYEKNRGFRPICLFVSETSEWPLNQISRSRCYSTSNNSKTVQDRAMFTMAHQ